MISATATCRQQIIIYHHHCSVAQSHNYNEFFQPPHSSSWPSLLGQLTSLGLTPVSIRAPYYNHLHNNKAYLWKITLQHRKNKINSLRRCKSWVHFTKIHILENYSFEMEVWKLLVIDFRIYILPWSAEALSNGPETPTQWKSESVTDQCTKGPTYSSG